VVRVPGYRSRGPGSIPGATRFCEKQWSWNGVHSATRVQLRSCLKEKVAVPVQKTEITVVGIHSADHVTSLYPQKLALTSPTSGCHSVGIVRSRTKATEFVFCVCFTFHLTVLLISQHKYDTFRIQMRKLEYYIVTCLMTKHGIRIGNFPY
jgi:hypothetical protein